MPKEELKYISPRDLEKMINKVKKIITVHLYPFSHEIKREKCLLNL